MADMTDAPVTSGGTTPEEPEGITRRELLANTLVAAAFIGTGVGIVNAVIRYLIPPKQAIGGTSDKVEIAQTTELPDGASKSFVYNSVPCAVINVGGEYKAFSRVCTHLQCAVEWESSSKTFLCPCHAAVFDGSGKVVSGPAPKPLPELNVIIDGCIVYVGGWA
jgi:cytochrome b6-f complex iron-sulfur subunit